MHRNLRSGEPATIPNRKKVAIRAVFLFSVPLQKVQGGIGDGVAQVRRCGMIQVRPKSDVAG
nr:MAG TPA: hypothetical protein [Caudoviricetes sp.]